MEMREHLGTNSVARHSARYAASRSVSLCRHRRAADTVSLTATCRHLPRITWLIAIFIAAAATAPGCSSTTGANSWRWPWQSAATPASTNPFITNAGKPGSVPLGTQQAVVPATATEWPDEKRAARDLKLALAQMLEQQGAAPEAIEAYENVLRSEPGHTAVAHRLAVLLDKSGQSRRAEPYYQACLRATPSDPDLLSDFAYHCYLERRWADAETNLQRALSLNPRHVRARNNLGLVLARTERPREAFDQFAGTGCSTADAHANVAFALAAESRLEDAEQVYKIALQVDPQHQRAREGLMALRQARRVAMASRGGVPATAGVNGANVNGANVNGANVNGAGANVAGRNSTGANGASPRADAPGMGGPVLR
jgi:Tfp pilus assembly protein PilF